MTKPTRIGDFSLQWGESLCWDEQRGRLYFVDCATQKLHWLEKAEPPLRSLQLPSMPTGLALTEDGRTVIALDEGLHVVDPDKEQVELLALYPDGLGKRANDLCADLDGNLVTGTLNMNPVGKGSYWWYSARDGWRQLDDGIGNANGPVVLGDVSPTLVFPDTLGFCLNAYDYDGAAGTASGKRVFADTRSIGGMPDGACADSDGGVWSCLLAAGKIVRYTAAGEDQVIDTGVELPSDVTFGGEGPRRMFFVSIAVSVAGIEITSPHAGALMAVDGTGFTGAPEPRFRL